MRIIRQYEIEELSNKILGVCEVLPVSVVKEFLRKRGKSDEQTDIILNQLVKNRLAAYDNSKTFLRANKSVTVQNMRPAYVKTMWLFCDIISKISDDYFFQYDMPRTLTFRKLDVPSESAFFDVLYFSFGNEILDCFNANNMFKTNGSDTKVFIIIDNQSQISKIKLNPNIQVVSYVLVSPEGKVSYVNAE